MFTAAEIRDEHRLLIHGWKTSGKRRGTPARSMVEYFKETVPPELPKAARKPAGETRIGNVIRRTY